jgi:hypothetical protein
MTSEGERLKVVFTNVPHLDVERVCRVLIRIATYLEEENYENLSKEEQECQQEQSTINGMESR